MIVVWIFGFVRKLILLMHEAGFTIFTLMLSLFVYVIKTSAIV